MFRGTDFLSFSVQAQIVNPAISASMERDVTLPQRDVRRLLNEAQRVDLIEQEREIRRQAKEAAEKHFLPQSPRNSEMAFVSFFLRFISHRVRF